MPHFKVLKEESINGRQPQPVGTVVILSSGEAAPFVANKVLEAIDTPAEDPAPASSPVSPTAPAEEH